MLVHSAILGGVVKVFVRRLSLNQGKDTANFFKNEISENVFFDHFSGQLLPLL